eukprot:7385730-Prymnesium_polylepis.1
MQPTVAVVWAPTSPQSRQRASNWSKYSEDPLTLSQSSHPVGERTHARCSIFAWGLPTVGSNRRAHLGHGIQTHNIHHRRFQRPHRPDSYSSCHSVCTGTLCSGDRGVQPAGDAFNIGAQCTLVCGTLGVGAVVVISADGAGGRTSDRALPCFAAPASICASLNLELTLGTNVTHGAAWCRLDRSGFAEDTQRVARVSFELALRAQTASATRTGLATGPAAAHAILERQLVAWAQCVAIKTSHGSLAGQLQRQCKRAVSRHFK